MCIYQWLLWNITWSEVYNSTFARINNPIFQDKRCFFHKCPPFDPEIGSKFGLHVKKIASNRTWHVAIKRCPKSCISPLQPSTSCLPNFAYISPKHSVASICRSSHHQRKWQICSKYLQFHGMPNVYKQQNTFIVEIANQALWCTFWSTKCYGCGEALPGWNRLRIWFCITWRFCWAVIASSG